MLGRLSETLANTVDQLERPGTSVSPLTTPRQLTQHDLHVASRLSGRPDTVSTEDEICHGEARTLSKTMAAYVNQSKYRDGRYGTAPPCQRLSTHMCRSAPRRIARLNNESSIGTGCCATGEETEGWSGEFRRGAGGLVLKFESAVFLFCPNCGPLDMCLLFHIQSSRQRILSD